MRIYSHSFLVAILVMTAACSSRAKKADEPAAPTPPAAAPSNAAEPAAKEAATAGTASEASASPAADSSAAQQHGGAENKSPSAKQVAAALKPPQGTKPGSEPNFKAPEGVEPSKALGWLQNGNKRFQKGWFRKDGQSKKDVQRLSHDQKPHSIILACSDSRVPPEIVFDQKLGEVFVVRTAGESIDDNVVASIEYAIEHLGSRLLVVMGHTACGAVGAAIQTLNGGDAGSPALNHLVADIHPRIKSSFGKETGEDFAAQSLANAKGVAADLMKRSEIIRTAVEQGHVSVKTALYHMNTGEVKFQ